MKMNKFNLKTRSNLDSDYSHTVRFFSSDFIWKFYNNNSNIHEFVPVKYNKLPEFCFNRKIKIHNFGIQLEKYLK
jgi:hypothetical protein